MTATAYWNKTVVTHEFIEKPSIMLCSLVLKKSSSFNESVVSSDDKLTNWKLKEFDDSFSQIC